MTQLNSALKQVSSNVVFAGLHQQYQHQSEALSCQMRFAIYLPPQASKNHKVPVLYWLSGLTCSDENFMQKSGVQRIAAELGIAIVAPDTSPRGDEVFDDAQAYDLGKGAGFYVNATQAPWSKHYKMYDYIVDELPRLIEANFPVSERRSISGHSMGGHGALMFALRNPKMFLSASAFSPICHPTQCPWGQKAFTAYLGSDTAQWQQYDSTLLMSQAKLDKKVPMLVDQGSDDDFLTEQLMPRRLEFASNESDYPLTLNVREGYDHSYYFIATFIEQHLKFHAQFLSTVGS